MRTAPGVLVHTASVLRREPLVYASQMNGATAAFGETNGLVGVLMEDIHADDTSLIDLKGITAFECDHDGFADGGAQHPGQPRIGFV